MIQVQGQIRCRRCGVSNRFQAQQVPGVRVIAAPQVRQPVLHGTVIRADVKACPDCGLPTMRAVKYRTLLRMADAYLETGSHQAALSVCQAADQILPGPAVNQACPPSRRASTRGHGPCPATAQAWTGLKQP